jgi:probable addiction module antidote protein
MARHPRFEEVLDEDLKDPSEAVEYLNACLEDGDPDAFLLALRDVARAQGGVAKLAETTALNREHLYRMLSERGQPRPAQPRIAARRDGFSPCSDTQGSELGARYRSAPFSGDTSRSQSG